jgi:UDP-N-acetylmuramate-alanine ligase
VSRDRLPAALAATAVPGDLVLCLGAGDITGVSTELIALLETKALS